MWSFRGPTLGWALTLFYITSPTISRLATPFVDGTAGSAAATADCTAGSRPFPGRNQQWIRRLGEFWIGIPDIAIVTL